MRIGEVEVDARPETGSFATRASAPIDVVGEEGAERFEAGSSSTRRSEDSEDEERPRARPVSPGGVGGLAKTGESLGEADR